MEKLNDSLLKEAIEMFGSDTVHEVRTIVELSDIDGAISMFEDMSKFDHADCVQFLYITDEY
jgi:hypothetical protein